MAGRPTRQHLSRFAQWERPTAYADRAVRECSVKGASVLKHTAGDSRAVAETRNRLTGARIVLCADCLSYVEAYHWAVANGVHQMSEHKLLALAYVWRAECGYEVPTPLAYRGSLAELGAVTNALNSLARTGHIKRIGNRYLMRDACPSCFRRGGCTEQCMLHMGVSFAPRREAHLLRSQNMRRTMLLSILALTIGCEPQIDQSAQSLAVYPIPGLPAYDGGRILHPWHFSKLDRDRFPARPIVASASDADCVLGDDRFDKCRIYDCEVTPCPSGTCWDVAMMYDPDGSPAPVPNWLGIPVVTLPSGLYYQPLHQATCLR